MDDPMMMPNPDPHHRKAVLIHPVIDAKYRHRKTACIHCGDDRYTRFRYFNNKKAVLMRGKEPQPRYACQSPVCLAANPGKSEVQFTLDGKTRKPYARGSKKKRTASDDHGIEESRGGGSRKNKKFRPSSALSHTHTLHMAMTGAAPDALNAATCSSLPAAPDALNAATCSSLPLLVDMDLDLATFEEDLALLLDTHNNTNLQEEEEEEIAAASSGNTTSLVHQQIHEFLLQGVDHENGDDVFGLPELVGCISNDDHVEHKPLASMEVPPTALDLLQHDNQLQQQQQELEPLVLQPWEEEDSLEGLEDIVAIVDEDEEVDELVRMLDLLQHDNQLQQQQELEPLVLQPWEEEDSPEGLEDIVSIVAEDKEEEELDELVRMLEDELEEPLEEEEDVDLYFDPQDDDLLPADSISASHDVQNINFIV